MVEYIDILYHKYLDENMKKVVGGVQTYITDLVDIFTKAGKKVRVIQFSEKNFKYKINDSCFVLGFEIVCKNQKKRFQRLYNLSLETAENKNELLTIFASEIIIPNEIKSRSLVIQHGIFWDIPLKKKRPEYRRMISRALQAHNIIEKIEKVDSVVCVDYNFLNWYRTQVDRVRNNLCVIPNYTAIGQDCEKCKDIIKIIFARRLFEYRGTRIFTNVAKKLLEKYSNVHITIAGNGPDEKWMKDKLQSFENVSFISYDCCESLKVHSDKHIAVVPTVGSEGTSLSLLEAMASQCAVVCTNVGGMTNIVLNGYNGIMINPSDENQLYEAISNLIENPEKIKEISSRAYETVTHSFSHDVWAEKWLTLIQNM